MTQIWRAVFLMLVGCQATSTASWRQNILVARRQQTLSQKISAEALMIVADIDPAVQRQKLAADMAQFDATMVALVHGDGEMLPPNEPARKVLQEVEGEWQSLTLILTQIMGTNYNATALVPPLASQNLYVYNKLGQLTDLFVNNALVDYGINATNRRNDLLERQGALIYKMWKETFLISHGVISYSQMLETKTLFTSTHRGIIDGARWIDMPKLSEVCALRAMTEVTYFSDQLEVLLLTIASAEEDAPSVAANLGVNVSEISSSLSSAMTNALTYFENPTCDKPQLTDLEWFNALTTAQDQLLQASKATQLFLQIALEYQVAESKVQLTLLSDDATLSLRNLLEGNKAAGLVAPPTQALADGITSVKDVWQGMRAEFTKAIFSDSIPVSSVSEIIRLTKLFTEGIESAVSLYVRTALLAGTTIPAYTLDLASRQRTKVQKLAKEASIVNLGYSVEENWAAFNATNALLLETHWTLLQGTPAAYPYPAVNATTDICIVQQMWRALGVYGQLQTAAEKVLGGDKSLSKMDEYIQEFDRQMSVAVDWYKISSEGLASCEKFTPSLDQWRGLIREVGTFRTLSQEVSSAFLLLELNMSTTETVMERREALNIAAKNLRFGSHFPLVPPPPVQHLLDSVTANLLPAVSAFHQALESEDHMQIFNRSSALLLEADRFLETYFVEGEASQEPAPLKRMDLASKQITLAQSVFRDYVLLSGNGTAQTSMAETMATFESIHHSFVNGGHGIAPLSLVRQDALKQWERTGQAWQTFREQVQISPSALTDRSLLVGNAAGALAALVTELEVGVQMFGIQDEEMRGEVIWPIIAYSSLVVCMISCICAAIYAVRRRYQERAKWSSDAHDKV